MALQFDHFVEKGHFKFEILVKTNQSAHREVETIMIGYDFNI